MQNAHTHKLLYTSLQRKLIFMGGATHKLFNNQNFLICGNPVSHHILRLCVCMSVTIRNANFLYTTCARSMVHAHSRTIVLYEYGQQAQCMKTGNDGSICTMIGTMDNRTHPTKDESDRI